MELAVNMFNNGLQMDSHPMITGNDVLTDALNATFVTMNGNEVILQNDMGNRRIDRAFLPAGYEPVGIKEYGGVIYIAAYNPITNRSLIGSFPSPERHMSTNDGSMPAAGNFNFDLFENNCSEGILSQDSYLIPLTGENVLHAGDKFVVYSKELWGNREDGTLWEELITNFNNTGTDDNGSKKVKTPKNKCYTLSLGILNSQNEFVDITNTLHRWKKGNKKVKKVNGKWIENSEGSILWEIQDYTNESDLYKFNDGYFIPSYGFNNSSGELTIADYLLSLERQVLEANTYAYKLVGPLYLKVLLNHILDFNYVISGEKINGEANLYIEGYFKYNCPDNITSELNNKTITDKGDDNYLKYELGYPVLSDSNKQNWFDVTIAGSAGNNIEIGPSDEKDSNNNYKFPDEVPENNPITYDPITNLYTAKIVKKVSGITNPASSNPGNNMFSYSINVNLNAFIDCTIPGLNLGGQLDFTKLGSGEINLIGWRFTSSVSKKQSYIIYNFESYLRHKLKVNDCTITFYRVDENGVNSNRSFFMNVPVLNTGTIELNWEDFPDMKERSLYLVKIEYEDDEDNNNNRTYIRWFLNTELMNDCFNVSSSSFIQDYGDPNEGLEKDILNDKLTIKLSPEINYQDLSKPIEAEAPDNDVKLFAKSSSELTVLYSSILDINVEVTAKIKSDNENLYPDFVQMEEFNDSSLINKVSLDNTSITPTPINPEITYYSKGGKTLENITLFEWKENLTEFNLQKKTISGKLIYRDCFKCNYTNNDISIINPFIDIKNDEFFKEGIGIENNKFKYYGGINPAVDTDGEGYLRQKGVMWLTLINVSNFINLPSAQLWLDSNDHNLIDLSKSLAHNSGLIYETDYWGESGCEGVTKKVVKIDDMLLSIYSVFNSVEEKNSRQVFMFMFDSSSGNIGDRRTMGSYTFSTCCRVWWKTKNNSWALLKTPFNRGQNNSEINIINALIDFIINDYIKGGNNNIHVIYCPKNELSLLELGLYAPDNNNIVYNYKYNFTIPIKLNYTNSSNKGYNDLKIECSNKEGNNEKEITFNVLFNTNGTNSTNIINISNSSSESFLDLMDEIIRLNYSNIYIETGAKLKNPNQLYTYDENTKEIISNTRIPISISREDNEFLLKIDQSKISNGSIGNSPSPLSDVCNYKRRIEITYLNSSNLYVVSPFNLR